MTDDTHVPQAEPEAADTAATDEQRRSDGFVDGSFGGQIDRLALEGDQLIGDVRPWSDSVREVLERFEGILRPHQLTDDAHHAIGVAVGIDELYEQLDELSQLSEPMPQR